MFFISHIIFHEVPNVFVVITISSHRLSVCCTYVHGIIDTQVTIVHYVPVHIL